MSESENILGATSGRSPVSHPNILQAHLEPFHEYSGCKKCGASSSSIGTRYVRLPFGSEVIRRTCGRCGYVWDQRPRDTKPLTQATSPKSPPSSDVAHSDDAGGGV